MNGGDHTLASRVAQLRRRVRTLSVLLGITGIFATASGILAAWHAYDAREARKHDAFSKRKIQYLELRLSTHTAQADRRLLTLERQMETTRLRARQGELTTVRRWLSRADQAMSEDRARIEDLERRLGVPKDSLRTSLKGRP